MTGVLPEVADAVAQGLNDGSFSIDFEAIRSYAGWRVKLENLAVDEFRVDVVPVDVADEVLAARAVTSATQFVDIVVRKKFAKDDVEGGVILNDAMDPWVAFVEELKQFFLKQSKRRLVHYSNAAWESVETLFPYVPKHLPGLFTGVVRVGFRVTKKEP